MKRVLMSRMISVILAVSMIFVLAACGNKEADNEETRPFIDALDDGGAQANFDKTDKGTGGSTGITVEEGEYLVIETALTEGKVHVTVVREDPDSSSVPTQETDTPATIDYVFEGSGTTEYMEIEAGDYTFGVMVEEKATGTITASKKKK